MANGTQPTFDWKSPGTYIKAIVAAIVGAVTAIVSALTALPSGQASVSSFTELTWWTVAGTAVISFGAVFGVKNKTP